MQKIARARFLTAMCLYTDWTGQKCGLLFQEHIAKSHSEDESRFLPDNNISIRHPRLGLSPNNH